MKEVIIEILREMSIDVRYYNLYLRYNDIKNTYPLKRNDVESVIKSYDSGFKYITGDRVFMKEFMYEEYSVCFCIGFKSGLISFFYSIWIEGSGEDGCTGDLHKLAQYVDPNFNEKTYYKVICAETLEEAHYIIDQIFKMLTEFTELFRQRVRDIEV